MANDVKPRLSSANVFCKDIIALSNFYATVFGFFEVVAVRSPIYRALDVGGAQMGFNAEDAYALLNLADQADASGTRGLLTFDVAREEEVEERVQVAVKHGATLIKAPYTTYYHCLQAVLSDPEGHIFRINFPLPK